MATAAVKNAAQSGMSTPKEQRLTIVLNTAVGDAKTRQMEGFTQHQDKNTPLTTYFGTKIAETDVALRAGARGPTVLEGTSRFYHFYNIFAFSPFSSCFFVKARLYIMLICSRLP
jgi:hypothetical protein